MRIEDANVQTIRDLWSRTEPRLGKARALEDAAQTLAEAVVGQFSDSVTLARVFVTLPFEGLPPDVHTFAQTLAEGAHVESELRPDTRILSLVGTSGKEPEWNDRRRSKGHVGIPLSSARFVAGIPMISRLLKELGVPIEWIDRRDTEIVTKKLGDVSGLFHVDNAVEATDHEGRKIIAAQDFVREYRIRSVFGVGGAYVGGNIVVLIVFCHDAVPRRAAERFLPLVHLFKSKTTALASPNKAFAQAT